MTQHSSHAGHAGNSDRSDLDLAGGDAAALLQGSRKDDHIRHALAQQGSGINSGAVSTGSLDSRGSDWDCIRFVHHALAAVDVASVDLRTVVAGMHWEHPLYINAMTGGTDAAQLINTRLAEAAAATNTPIASGSLGIAVDNPDTIPSFRVLRSLNPDGFVIANIGAGRPLADAQLAVDILEANALQVHLNAAQEIVMPEGSREFSHWLELLAEIVARVSVPVIVKEVGFGLSARTLTQLAEIGVQTADVAGRGGTNFAQIEAARRDTDAPFAELNGWGQSAAECLLDAAAAPTGLTLLASGGIQNPLDAIKGLALGAQGAGVAGRILREAAVHDSEYIAAQIAQFKSRMVDIAALLGARTLADLQSTDLLITGNLKEFMRLRGIDAAPYSARSGARA